MGALRCCVTELKGSGESSFHIMKFCNPKGSLAAHTRIVLACCHTACGYAPMKSIRSARRGSSGKGMGSEICGGLDRKG